LTDETKESLLRILDRQLSILGEQLNENLWLGSGEVARIFDGLPVDVRPGVVALELNNDEIADLVDRDEVGAFRGRVERVALFRYYQQLLTENLGSLIDPLLQILPFLECERCEIDLVNLVECLPLEIHPVKSTRSHG